MATYIVSNETTHVVFDSLEAAIREWDARCLTRGALTVMERDEHGNVIRDGYIIRIRPDGSVYVNPQLAAGMGVAA